MLAVPAAGVASTFPGVDAPNAPGARLLRALWLPNNPPVPAPGRCADIGAPPPSKAFAPELERWKTGCDGRPGMRLWREPLMERACEVLNAPARFWPEFERFMAEDGMGIAEETFGLMPPRVCW